MIYVFLGIDFNVLNSKVNDLVSKLNINNIIKYDSNETSLKEVLDEINYIDLFNEKKLVIVSSFSFKKIKEEDENLLLKYIDNMNDNVIIFKCNEESLDERKKLTKKLREKCKVEIIKKLDYKDLNQYITNMLKEKGIRCSFNQVKKILDLCDYNPDYTINEVNKLLIYKTGETELYDEDIDNVISKNTEKEIFTFTENILKKDVGGAIDSFKILSSSNLDETLIIDAVAKQFRLLYQIKLLYPSNSIEELSRLLGVNPYTIQKTLPFTRSYSEEEIAKKLYDLSEVDSDIKIKGLDRYKVIEMFLLSL